MHPERRAAAGGAPPPTLTYGALRRRVAALAAALRDDCGVGPGDRVAGYIPNTPDAIVAMLAATALGASWSRCGDRAETVRALS